MVSKVGQRSMGSIAISNSIPWLHRCVRWGTWVGHTAISILWSLGSVRWGTGAGHTAISYLRSLGSVRWGMATGHTAISFLRSLGSVRWGTGAGHSAISFLRSLGSVRWGMGGMAHSYFLPSFGLWGRSDGARGGALSYLEIDISCTFHLIFLLISHLSDLYWQKVYRCKKVDWHVHLTSNKQMAEMKLRMSKWYTVARK